MEAPLPLFARVRVVAIRDDRFAGEKVFRVRHPRVGDDACVIGVYGSSELAYEVECSDPATGVTVWLEAMHPDEIEARAEDTP